jgi:anaerobic ribonucleoside-triphosphate reductase
MTKKGEKMTAKELQGLDAQRTKCEVYSRVVGYIRPVAQWNDGKQAEYADRKEFVVADC